MGKKIFQKIALIILELLLVFSPYAPFALNAIPARAAMVDGEQLDDSIDDSGGMALDSAIFSETNQPQDSTGTIVTDSSTPASINSLDALAFQYGLTSDIGTTAPASATANGTTIALQSVMSFSDIIGQTDGAKIIMPQSDLTAVQGLSCLLSIIPDFEGNPALLANNGVLPAKDLSEISSAISTEASHSPPRYTDLSSYMQFLQNGRANEDPMEALANRNIFRGYVTDARASYSNSTLTDLLLTQTNNLGNGQPNTLTVSTIQCLTGMDANDIKARMASPSQSNLQTLAAAIQAGADNSLKIDVRILKTLVYLVTPKDQGGAGHWRIQVSKLLQTDSKSKESDATIASLKGQTTTSVTCDASMTAAQCGAQQNTAANGTVSDQNGDQYDVYLQAMDAEENQFLAAQNMSAHSTGQAVDISEIDDIRCTQVKSANLFGGNSYTKSPARPIKLAWQTNNGFQQSGGANDYDTMSMLKSLAADGVTQFLSQTGSDVTTYNGNLANASFDDLINIVGKSLLGYIVNTQSLNLSGYSIEDTLHNLGGMYLADYLGLPREVFAGQDLSSVDNVEYLIGRAAIEQRLGLPFGSFSGSNLAGVLNSVGRRKIEYEMGLKPDSLIDYFNAKTTGPSTNVAQPFDFYVGARIIEDKLSMAKYAWPDTNISFSDLSKQAGFVRADLMQTDPGYLDSLLHLDSGTTDSFAKGTISSLVYASKVGAACINETALGLKYFAVSNAAYRLPGPTKDNPTIPDTWGMALKGDSTAMQTVGIYTLARLLGDDSLTPTTTPGQTISEIDVVENGAPEVIDSTEFGFFVFRSWLRANLAKTDASTCTVKKADVKVAVKVDKNGVPIESKNVNDPTLTLQTADTKPADITADVSYSMKAKDKDGVDIVLTYTNEEFVVNETKGKAAGLQNLDLQRMLGCSSTNGQATFERIGSTLLYTDLATKALSPTDKVQIDLKNQNPTIGIDNDRVSFYYSRYVKITDLIVQLKKDETTLKNDAIINSVSTAKDSLIDLDAAIAAVDKVAGDVKNDGSNTSWTTIQTVINMSADIMVDIDNVKAKMEAIRQLVHTKGDLANSEIDNVINPMIDRINQLSLAVSEILAGKPIDAANSITIKQLQDISMQSTQSTTPNYSVSNNGVTGKPGLTNWQILEMIFLFLSGKINVTDMLFRLGANSAETKLGLPVNSLVYLVQNYEKRGITGTDAFYQAIGQAQIESTYNLPIFYFQGFNPDTTNTMPNFNFFNSSPVDLPTVQKWLPDDGYAWEKGLSAGAFQVDIDDLMTHPSDGGHRELSKMTLAATNNWTAARKAQIAKYGQGSVNGENTVADIVKNISNQKLTDGIRSPENDLLFRLGFSTGQFSGLASNSSVAWMTGSNSEALATDQKLDVASGTTRALFTGQSSKYQAGLSSKETQQLEAGLKIDKNVLANYVQILDQNILPSQFNEYGTGLSPDYTGVNPYAPPAVDPSNPTSTSACPIIYTTKGGFTVNEKTLSNNSYCYYDKTGRHCFDSWEQAQQYSTAHPDDQIHDVIFAVLVSLTETYNGAIPLDTATEMADLQQKIIDFSQGKINSVFTDDEWKKIDAATPPDGQSKVPLATLKKIFSRATVLSPVGYFKYQVGEVVAGKILTSALFNSLGLKTSQTLFDAGDVYDILSGDYSSLSRIASGYVDQVLQIKPGTTLLIYNARTAGARNCALAQAGGTMLGGLVGLNYVPIAGMDLNNFVSNIGEAKVEETLNLPRGTFTGASLSDVINKMGPIGFMVGFKIPWTTELPQAIVDQILGPVAGEALINSPPGYVLQQIQQFMTTSPVLSNSALSSIRDLNQLLLTSYIPQILINLKVPFDSLVTSGDQNDQLWIQSVNIFYQFMSTSDNLLGLGHYKTYELLSGHISPNDFNDQVGIKLGEKIAAVDIGGAFGLSAAQSTAAAGFITNISNVTRCQSEKISNPALYAVHTSDSTLVNNKASSDCRSATPSNLFLQLMQIFPNHLDNQLGLDQNTMSRIIADPSIAFPTMLQIGAGKLDAQLKLDPSKPYSFTGLFAGMYQADSYAKKAADQACYDLPDAFGNSKDAELATKYDGFDQDRLAAVAAFPADLPKFDLTNMPAGYFDGLSDSQKVELQAWEPSYTAVINNLNTINTEIGVRNAVEQDCKTGKRANFGVADSSGNILKDNHGNVIPPDMYNHFTEWAISAAAGYIHDQIFGISATTNGKTERVGIDMPAGDIEKLFKGDTRYIPIAAGAFAANIVTFEINNAITTHNCAGTMDGTQCTERVPSGMLINYDDIKAATFGNTQVDTSLNSTAVYAAMNDTTPNPTQIRAADGSTAPKDGDGFQAGLTYLAGPTNKLAVHDSVQNNIVATQDAYGFDPSKQAAVDAYVSSVNSNIATINATCATQTAAVDPSAGTGSPLYQSCISQQQYLQYGANSSNWPTNQLSNIETKKKEVTKESRDIFTKNLEYKLLDIGLWKLDDNVYPGFARAMVVGTPQIRLEALTQYIKNGIQSGHLAGINFQPLLTVQAWAQVGLWVTNIDTPGAFATFAGTGGFNMLNNIITSNSKKWFGFELTPDMAKGILVGIGTGVWGISGFDLSGVASDSAKGTVVNGQNMPTLGSAVVNYGAGWLFSWADKSLGIPAGKSFELFKAGVDVYVAATNYAKAVQAVIDAEAKLAEATALSMSHGVAVAGGAEKVAAATGDVASKAQALKDAAIAKTAKLSALVELGVDILVDKLLGKQISQWENDMGMIPGTLEMSVSMIAYNAVAYAVNTVAASHVLNYLSPWFALGAALLGWALGAKYYYYCDADGYYPRQGSPDYVHNDISGLGVWGGRINNNLNDTIQQYSVLAAQYKARQLIGDLLNLGSSTTFTTNGGQPIIPAQIMTGRKEDVDYWDSRITTDMCQTIDKSLVSVGGICGAKNLLGDGYTDTTRTGIWSNLQTIGWTHIGF